MFQALLTPHASGGRTSARRAAGIIALLIAWAGPAWADDPGDPGTGDAHGREGGLVEELILGESPHPQEAGEFQLTLSVEHLSGDEEHTTDIVAEVEVGLTDSFQIGVELPYRFLDGKAGEEDADGVGDVGLSALCRFVQEGPLVLSGVVEVNLPSGDDDRELGEGAIEVEPMLLGAIRLDGVEAYAGVGGEFTDDEEAFTYSAGLAALLGPLVGLLEVSGVVGGEAGEDEAFIAPGLAAEVADDVQLLIGVPIGLNDDSADWGVTFRIAIEF